MGLPYLQEGARERKEDYRDILVGIGSGGNLLCERPLIGDQRSGINRRCFATEPQKTPRWNLFGEGGGLEGKGFREELGELGGERVRGGTETRLAGGDGGSYGV